MAMTSENSEALREAASLLNQVAEGQARGLRKVPVVDGECEPVLPRGCTALVKAADAGALRAGSLVMLRTGQYLRARQLTRASRGMLHVVVPGGDLEVEETVETARLVGEVVGYDLRGKRHIFQLKSEPAKGLAGLLQRLGFRR